MKCLFIERQILFMFLVYFLCFPENKLFFRLASEKFFKLIIEKGMKSRRNES